MSDNKKYYYLKLVDNFYERDEMIILESMPDGYMYSNILLKLYLRSLKNNGKLMFNNRIPYNSTMLANVTRFPVAVVEKAIVTFKNLGLIEVLDNGAIYVLDIQNFIGQSSTEADRKREYRNKIEEEKKALGQISGHLSDKTPPEIEIEIEIDTELELNTTQSSAVVDTNTEFIESKTHLKLTKNMKKIAQSWEKERLSKSIELFTLKEGKYFSLLEKIYKDDGNFINNSIDSKNVNYTNPSNKFANFKPNYLDEFESMEAFDEFIENDFRKQ